MQRTAFWVNLLFFWIITVKPVSGMLILFFFFSMNLTDPPQGHDTVETPRNPLFTDLNIQHLCSSVLNTSFRNACEVTHVQSKSLIAFHFVYFCSTGRIA